MPDEKRWNELDGDEQQRERERQAAAVAKGASRGGKVSDASKNKKDSAAKSDSEDKPDA